MIAVIVMMFCMVMVVVGAYLFLNRPQEGDECEGKDENGNYVIDDEGKCVLDDCVSGYYKSGKECLVDQSGVDCEPEGTPDPRGTYLTNQMGGCDLSSCESPYVVSGDVCSVPEGTELMEDGQPYAYVEGTLYTCKSGKDVGCLYRSEANGIAAAAGMYDPATKTCPGGDHVYCVNDKTITYAQYADNTDVKTQSGWQNNMHRYKADGARCNKPENAQCQDDQSIASYSGWGGGNTAKITTEVDTRQCVDNAFVYCPNNAI